MEINAITKWLPVSISGLATILTEHLWGEDTPFYDNPIIKKHMSGIFSNCVQEKKDNAIYVLFDNHKDVEEYVSPRIYSQDFFLEELRISDSIIYKLSREYWYSNSEWNKIKKSDYSPLLAPNDEDDLLYLIKHNSLRLKDLMEEHLNVPNIPENNIYWKPFILEDETLDLSKIDEFTMKMQYNKKWLEERIKNSPSFLKPAYKEVYENSTPVEKKSSDKKTSSTTTFTNDNFNVEDLHQRIKDRVKELTGKSQIYLKWKGNPKKYAIIPNLTDFKKKIQELRLLYKPEDMYKVEACIMTFLEDPTSKLVNYICKHRISALMDDYEMLDEIIKEKNKYKDLNTDDFY